MAKDNFLFMLSIIFIVTLVKKRKEKKRVGEILWGHYIVNSPNSQKKSSLHVNFPAEA